MSFTSQLKTAQLIEALKKGGVYNAKFNIVGLEGITVKNNKVVKTDDAPNEFNDMLAVIIDDEVVDVYRITTEPGRYYTINPMNTAGCARVDFGSYKNCWAIGLHGTDQRFRHQALVQVGNITVCRDLNEDYKRVGDKRFTGSDYGINCHAQPWSDLSEEIGRSSAGCQVFFDYAQQKIFMRLCKASGLKLFSYSLFDGADYIT